MVRGKTPKDWLRKFYPGDASRVRKANAVAHSLQKWQGLRVLKEYGLCLQDGIVLDENGKPVLHLGSDTCALCAHYYDSSPDGIGNDSCKTCPLCIARDGIACDAVREDEESSPYWKGVIDENPEAMILWLEKAARLEAERKTK